MLGFGGLKRGGSAQQRHRRQDRPHFDQGFQFSQVVFGGGGGVPSPGIVGGVCIHVGGPGVHVGVLGGHVFHVVVVLGVHGSGVSGGFGQGCSLQG